MEQGYLDDFDDDLQEESEKIRDAESIIGTAAKRGKKAVKGSVKKELPRRERSGAVELSSWPKERSSGEQKEQKERGPPPAATPHLDSPTKEAVKVKAVEVAAASHPASEIKPGDSNTWDNASTWRTLSVILIVLVVISVFTNGFSFAAPTSSSSSVPLSQVESKVVSFLNDYVLVPPFTASVADSKEEKGLYKLTLQIAGQTVDSYASTDGTLLFPQWINLTAPPKRPVGPQVIQRFDISIDNDPLLGEPSAPVTVISFSNFKCADCVRFYQEIFPKLKEQYINSGKVRFVFRDYPTPESEFLGLAGECALEQGNNHFWTFYERIYSHASAELTMETFTEWAKELNFNMERFTHCMNTNKYNKELYEDLADLRAAVGATPVPTILVNGRVIIGVPPWNELAQLIDEEYQVTGGVPSNAASQPVKITQEQIAEEQSPEVTLTPSEEEATPTVEEGEGSTEVLSASSSSLRLEAKRWRFLPKEFHVAVGQPVQLTVVSQDLAFTLAIPDFGITQEVPAGGQETVAFTPTQAGTFAFTCNDCEEFRGMTGTIVAE